MSRSPSTTKALTKTAAVESNAKEPFLQFLSQNKRMFDERLRRMLRDEQRRFPRVGQAVKLTTQSLIDLCERGGKRVRPGLLLAGSLCATPKPNLEAIVQAGAALELLHGYFLVHDDWMDGDLVRRGGPSVHAALRAKLGSIRLGDSAAVMAGDWGVAVATDWMARLSVPGKQLSAALKCFTEMQLAAVTGQIRDLLSADNRPELTYQLKTASYTVSGPVRLGAILGGASTAALDSLERFSMPIGVAFQLQDDLIGVFSPEAVTGKPAASDIKQGKRTVLLLEGQRRASASDLKLFRRAFGNPDAAPKDLANLIEFLCESGAKAHVEHRIQKLHTQALEVLALAKLRSTGKALLKSAATALIARGS